MNNNSIPFHIFKILFPKAANKGIRQPKTCKLKVIHNEKEKICKFFVAQNGSPAVLGMQDIAMLGLISLNYDAAHRQVAEGDSIDNSERQSQTEGDKCKQFKGKKQEAETQSTQNADNTPKPPIVTNPMVMGNNNNNNDLIADTRDNGSTNFLSELLSNHSLVSDEERKMP